MCAVVCNRHGQLLCEHCGVMGCACRCIGCQTEEEREPIVVEDEPGGGEPILVDDNAEKAGESRGGGAWNSHEQPRDNVGVEEGIAERVCGTWFSAKGECRVFRDRLTSKLTYEEPLGEGVRLHGFLERSEALAIHTPQIPREMALELVSGADFWCKLMSRGRPVDLRRSRGRSPG